MSLYIKYALFRQAEKYNRFTMMAVRFEATRLKQPYLCFSAGKLKENINFPGARFPSIIRREERKAPSIFLSSRLIW